MNLRPITWCENKINRKEFDSLQVAQSAFLISQAIKYLGKKHVQNSKTKENRPNEVI